jgi:hypothetical protein
MPALPSLYKIKSVLQKAFKIPDSDVSSSEQLLETYLSYRVIGQPLLTELLKYIPKNAIQVCGKKMEIVKGKTLLLNNEDELIVLYNYCLFHYYIGDKNAIDRYMTIHKDSLVSDKKTVALAMKNAQFSIFGIEKTLPHAGVIVADVLRGGKRELLIDKGFSESAVPGLLLASTILRYPEFITTTGTALPLNSISNRIELLLEDYARKYESFDLLPKTQQSKFIANLLKICFREEVSENIRYQDIL